MSDLRGDALQFENLVAHLLAKGGYRVWRDLTLSGDGLTKASFDMLAERRRRHRLIEVRWSILPVMPLGRLRDLAGSLVARQTGASANGEPTLVVSSKVNTDHKDWIEATFGVDVWGRDQLLEMAGRVGLTEGFEQLFARARPSAPGSFASSSEQARESASDAADAALKKDNAQRYLERLDTLSPGKANAYAYQDLCLEIINYLFGDCLKDVRPQQRTEQDLDIMDAVYRVRPGHRFWDTLTRDFRARIIVFEFKNYADPVPAPQVYSTERYVNTRALRSICFMLSRQGGHENAILAAIGALRESGKLMIFLSDDDLAQMIKFRRAQLAADPAEAIYEENDPTLLLDQKVYEFLAQVGR